MKYELTTPRSGTVVSLDEAKAHLVVEHNADDALIPIYIEQATTFAESQTGRQLGSQVWTLYADDWCGALELPFYPVQSVVIKYDDTDGTEQTLADDQYLLDAIAYPATIRPADGVTWPDTSGKPNCIRVEVTAGSDTLNGNIQAGIYLMLGHLYENREAVTHGTMTELPLGARMFFDAERLAT